MKKTIAIRKTLAISLIAGTLVTVGINAGASLAEDAGTGCWDVYTESGEMISRVVPKNITPADCTTGVGCFETYGIATEEFDTLVVPMGEDPATACLETPPTPVTTATTSTTVAASTSTTSTTSTTTPTTTSAPTTTSTPTTSVAPATTSAPTTSLAPTTTSAPTTTVAPTTTSAPTTTVAPTITEPPTPSSGDVFIERFEDPNSLDDWDAVVANSQAWNNKPTSWNGDHSASCGGPTTTRKINWPVLSKNSPDRRPVGEAMYWCAPKGEGSGHIMTAFLTGGYAHIDFTPKRSFVDVERVCWDQNVTNLGNRKWTQVTVVPKSTADAAAPRLDWTRPDTNRRNGPADWGLDLTNGAFMYSSTLGDVKTFTSGLPSGKSTRTDKTVSDKAKRVTTCIENVDQNRVVIEQERYDGSIVRTLVSGHIPQGEVKVVFQDASYNPNKAETRPLVANPFTWHWDNIIIES